MVIAVMTFIIQLILFILFAFLSYILWRTYRLSGSLAVRYYCLSIVLLTVGFLFDVLARVSGNLDVAKTLFWFYSVITTLAIPFLMLYLELNERPTIGPRFVSFLALSMILLAFRSISHFDVLYKNGFISRSGFEYYVGSFDVTNILLVLLVLWFAASHIHLTIMQMRRTKQKSTRNLLIGELVGFSVATLMLIIALVGLILNMFPPATKPIIINIPALILVFSITPVLYLKPFISYIAVQKIYGLTIFTKGGVMITEVALERKFKEMAPLLSSFFSAVTQAVSELTGMAEIKLIAFKDANVILSVGKRAMLMLLVDTPVDIHFRIANRIIQEVEKMGIGDIISDETIKKVNDMISYYVQPLFP